MKNIVLCFLLITLLKAYGSDDILNGIKNDLVQNSHTLQDDLSELSSSLKTQKWQNIKKSFFKARNTYKSIELFIAFLDEEFMNDYINGAPLKKIERKTPDLTILEPKGFQIIEEEIFNENLSHAQKLTAQLIIRVKEFNRRLVGLSLSHRMIFEIVRTGTIRLAALGITGFDTPSGENTKAESQIALKALQKTISAYNHLIDSNLKTQISQIFEHSKTYFNVRSFDNFNRFQFIQKVLNPIYKIALTAQKYLFIETRALATNFSFSTNYTSTNIFDTDFLNSDYYVNYSNSGHSEKKTELGKLLFYDPILSKNNQRACASCHQPTKGFSDGLTTSLAFNNEEALERNSPGLINSVYGTRFFWDNRANTPEAQVEHVIFNEKEFNTNYDEIISKLVSSPTYKTLFDEAFPEIKEINKYAIVGSLSAFIQSLRSFDSEFDQLIRGEIDSDRKADIERGFNIFTGKAACATCHFIPSFSGLVPPNFKETETEVLGIPDVNNRDKAKLDSDLGRYNNGRPTERADFYKFSFKTPTIRNIELTAPYMHNGVFPTLDEVMEYYNVGGGHGWGIAPANATLPEDELNLTADEIKQVIVFMQSLTDTVGMTSKPNQLPAIQLDKTTKNRVIGGIY